MEAFLERDIDLDPMAAAASVADLSGTILLHTQRNWHGSGGSVLLFQPRWTLRTQLGTDQALWQGDVPAGAPPATRLYHLFDRLLDQLGEHTRSPARGSGPAPSPLFAGWIGYDDGAGWHDARHPVPPPFELPGSWIGCFDVGLRFGDGLQPRLFARDLGPLARQPKNLQDRLDEAEALLRRGPPKRHAVVDRPRLSHLDREWHRRCVARIGEHLRAGDCYQINLTGHASCVTETDAFDHFLRHGAANPVAFSSYLKVDEATITSHSPERLLRLVGDRAETAPIKGTIEASADSIQVLQASAKDRAEHVMIVDLCRNDMARRAVAGTVKVEELMQPLSMRGLEHMVSRISARLRRQERGGLLAALFPGGSITGAPKLRAMQIIRELEPTGRGPYTGSIGYVEANGDMDWNIAIRTAVWQSGQVHFGCGGGIVLDSDADREYEEARLKARSFFDSLTER